MLILVNKKSVKSDESVFRKEGIRIVLIMLIVTNEKSDKSDKSVFNKEMNTDCADYADGGEWNIR